MLSLRPATEADFELYQRLLPELQVDDPPPERASWAKRALNTLVATREGQEVGLLSWQFLEGAGYVRQLIVDPNARRLGVGRALMNEVRRRLVAAGATRWALNVKPHNTAAIALYESLGFRRQYGSASYWLQWAHLPPPRPGEPEARRIEPDEEKSLEALFSLLPGQLATARADHRVLLTVKAEALAVFTPSFPGAFPFKTKSVELAVPLLRGMHRDALPGATFTGVVVEDDAALGAHLISLGGERRMVFDHYEGALTSAEPSRGVPSPAP